jgi:hypothetical protein
MMQGVLGVAVAHRINVSSQSANAVMRGARADASAAQALYPHSSNESYSAENYIYGSDVLRHGRKP